MIREVSPEGTCFTLKFSLNCKTEDSNLGCLNIHWTNKTDNNSTNNNFGFFFVSDLKIVYNNNY